MAQKKDYVQEFLNSLKSDEARKHYEDYLNSLTVKDKEGNIVKDSAVFVKQFNALPWEAITAGYGCTPGDFIAKADIEAVVKGTPTKNYYKKLYVLENGSVVDYKALKEMKEADASIKTLGSLETGYSFIFGKSFNGENLEISTIPAPAKPFSPKDNIVCMGAPLSQTIKDNLFKYGVGLAMHNVIDTETGEMKSYIVTLDQKSQKVQAFSSKYALSMFKDKDGSPKQVSILGHSITDSEKALLIVGQAVKATCSTEKNPEFQTSIVLTPGNRFAVSMLTERDEYKEYKEYQEKKNATQEKKAETRSESRSEAPAMAVDEVPNSGRKLD